MLKHSGQRIHLITNDGRLLRNVIDTHPRTELSLRASCTRQSPSARTTLQPADRPHRRTQSPSSPRPPGKPVSLRFCPWSVANRILKKKDGPNVELAQMATALTLISKQLTRTSRSWPRALNGNPWIGRLTPVPTDIRGTTSTDHQNQRRRRLSVLRLRAWPL